MTAERRFGLGPLGRRLLAAFILVAMSSVIVLTAAALIGTARGLTAGQDAQREVAVIATSTAAADAYSAAGGWADADLSRAEAVAAAAGAALSIRDADGAPISGGQGQSQGAGPNGAGRGGLSQPVIVGGVAVGTVRLGFGSPSTSTAQSIAWTWILAAAVAALVVALAVSWFVTRRISRPLMRLSEVTRAFASGDRAARADPSDVAAPGELGELARAFDATADDVVRSEQARLRMAADVAHELRTPLAALQAGLEELRDGLVEPDADRLAALHDQSVRLGRIVGDLAQLSAAETAALTLTRVPLDLGALVADAVAAARPTLAAAGIHVTTALAADVLVDGDADRLHQAVANVLVNAARYCRDGDSVTVTVTGTSSLALVSFADTGPGIAPADLPHVFDRLWRGSADRDVAGSGIGLAVVRELVTAHGGSVAAASDGISGTTFTLELPRATRA